MNIYSLILLSWIMLTLGWVIHFLSLMNHIGVKRGKRTSIRWFISARPYKFAVMCVMPLPLGLIEYITVSPQTLDWTTLQGRLVVAGYFAAMLATGAGSNMVIDKLGVNHALTQIDDDGDDYSTQVYHADDGPNEKAE